MLSFLLCLQSFKLLQPIKLFARQVSARMCLDNDGRTLSLKQLLLSLPPLLIKR